MNLPPKIRSDYNHLSLNYFNEGYPNPSRKWVKPSVWVIVGFIVGLLCTKILASKQDQQIAFNESAPTLNYQANASGFDQDMVPATANA